MSGRDFSQTDTRTAPQVAIVTEAFARKAWPDRDAIGQRLVVDPLPGHSPDLTVIGVAADAKLMSLSEEARPYIYVPLSQRSMASLSLLVKTRGEASAIPQVRALLREMNPNLPLTVAMPLREVTAIGLVPQRLVASVAGSLGIVGLVLAAIGIYGVTAYAVSRRTREIGIRVALGASRGRVLRDVLAGALTLVVPGIGAGLLLAVVWVRFVDPSWYPLGGVEPLVYTIAAATAFLVAVLAGIPSARRAAAVEPMVAMRTE